MEKKKEFFLGANSANGFVSLYDEFEHMDWVRDVLILKGGPGVGKSTLMNYVARRAEEYGVEVEYIRCSGDPDSLDAVLLKEKGTILADGTAPHVLEPRYAAAVERYVNLGRFYEIDRLKERRREIIACTDGYKGEYKKAYACLYAARAVREEMENTVAPWFDGEKFDRRLQNIWKRERKRKSGETGREEKRFLGSCTGQGRISCEGTLGVLCRRVYEIEDVWHLGAVYLQKLKNEIRADGYDVLLCMDPDVPERISHLLVPELGLGFVTADRSVSFPEKPYRRIRMERMLEKDGLHQMGGAMHLKERLSDALEQEGIEHLRMAGEKHEELEQIYHPFVDFDGVLALAEEECQRIFGK